jgi:hypothetical protein
VEEILMTKPILKLGQAITSSVSAYSRALNTPRRVVPSGYC